MLTNQMDSEMVALFDTIRTGSLYDHGWTRIYVDRSLEELTHSTQAFIRIFALADGG